MSKQTLITKEIKKSFESISLMQKARKKSYKLIKQSK